MIGIVFAAFGAIGLSGLLSHLSDRRMIGKILYVAIACLLIAICSFKEIGSDQDSVAYLKYFNLSDYAMSQVAEPTFMLISSISRAVSAENGIAVLFFIYALIGVTTKFVAIQSLTELKWLSLITYFSSYFLLHEFTQIRAAVASGLVLLSVKFIFERRLSLFLATIGGASLFHYSALLALPLYFLATSALSRTEKIAVGLSIPAGIVFYIFKFDIVYVIPIELVRIKIEAYTAVEALRSVKLNVFNAVYLFKYILLYVFLLFSDSISERAKYFPILLKLYAISMFSYLALSFNAAFAMRISELFGVVEIVLIPMLIYAIKPRALAVFLIVALAVANLALGVYQTELVQQTTW
jgi:hypothetical protein